MQRHGCAKSCHWRVRARHGSGAAALRQLGTTRASRAPVLERQRGEAAAGSAGCAAVQVVAGSGDGGGGSGHGRAPAVGAAVKTVQVRLAAGGARSKE